MRTSYPSYFAKGSDGGFRNGFTLVEVLVVVAMIGILAALLLPSLGTAKIKAQGVQCLSNLKQLSLGWQIYTGDNNNSFPPNSSTGNQHPTVGEDSANPSWVAGLMETNTFLDNTNISKLVGSAYASVGSIGDYEKNAGVYHCPADRSVDPANHLPRVRSVSMNGWVNPGRTNQHDSADWTMNFQKFTHPTDFGKISTSDIIVFLDENAVSINDGWLYICVDGYNSDGSINENMLNLYDVPAAYHNDSGAFTFADGHAELHRWQGGPVMNDNDIIWLMRHATVPQ